MAEITKRHTITIVRKTYAVNLQWNAVPNGGHAASIARESARRLGSEYLAVHTSPDGTVEYALGSKIREHLPGMESLASTIVSGRPGSWSAIFRLPSGEFYVVSSRNGAIEPQSDAIFSTLMSAHDCITDIDPNHTNPVYTDSSIQLKEARPWSLDEAIKAGKHNAKMVDVNIAEIYRRYATLAALAGIISFGSWYAYTSYFSEKPLPTTVVTQHIPSAPWLNKQAAGEELSDCLNVIERLPLGAPGWKRVSVACMDGSATAAYSREKNLNQGGTPLEWFRTSILSSGWPKKGLNEDSDKGLFTYTLPLPPPRTYWTKSSHTLPLSQSVSQLTRGLDALYTPTTITKPVGKFYTVTKVTFEAPQLARQYIALLNSIQGITLESVKMIDTKINITVNLAEALPPKGNIQYEVDPPPMIRTAINPDFADFYAHHQHAGEF